MLEAQGLESLTKLHFESYFNHASPFVRTMGLYVLVFLLAAFIFRRREILACSENACPE